MSSQPQPRSTPSWTADMSSTAVVVPRRRLQPQRPRLSSTAATGGPEGGGVAGRGSASSSTSASHDEPSAAEPVQSAQTAHPGGTSIEAIPERFRSVFKYPRFNAMQSKVLPDLLRTDRSLVISAPTVRSSCVRGLAALDLPCLGLAHSPPDPAALLSFAHVRLIHHLSDLCSSLSLDIRFNAGYWRAGGGQDRGA